MRTVGTILAWAICLATPSAYSAEPATFATYPTQGQIRLTGFLGDRFKANEMNWLLTAPLANPGMIEMFRARDRQPVPNLVPWAGEFVGKYLMSAIQALRFSPNPELQNRVSTVVADLISTQASDGYLGPFPEKERLKGHWDLWGHYHCLQALLMWHEATGNSAALDAAKRAADLICRTFLNSGLRVLDAGSPEMNMAVIHVFGQLYRLCREPAYLELIRQIEQDWQKAGDYLRTGLNGLEFFQTPKPRWESLHDLQGLTELFLITGQDVYATALQHHWRSILRWDRRNTGAFSSGEQATGNPYAPTAIETCCTVAWMALTTDILHLTRDSMAADELELATFNAIAGAQHPSGRWWTYNTPMDGFREASAHSIVFQARAGTPELNCCSVNGPRGLSLLAEWAVTRLQNGWALNYYGPGRFQGKLPDNSPLSLQWETDYPVSGKINVRVEPLTPRQFQLDFRIPSWAKTTLVRVNSEKPATAVPGQYFSLNRRWRMGDKVALQFEMNLRFVPGARETLNRVSLYRGPILLAYDPRYNAFDETNLPPIDLNRLAEAKLITPLPKTKPDPLQPWLLVDLQAANGTPVRLCDFASAGNTGTRYRSWLPCAASPPPPVVTRAPSDGTTVTAGDILFEWTEAGMRGANFDQYTLSISRSPEFTRPVLELANLTTNRHLLPAAASSLFATNHWYFWKITASNPFGLTESVRPPARFQVRLSPK